jgi:hypothetical protein
MFLSVVPSARCPVHRNAGATVLELMFVVGLVAVVSSMTVASAAEWRARTRSTGAARLVLAQVRLARAYAVKDGVNVGVVFRADSRGEQVFRLYRDGNDNGVRQADIDRGTDLPIGAAVRLSDTFSGTSLQVPVTLPAIEDGGSVAAGSNPIRLSGGGAILSCSPFGSATSGTLYVAGTRGEAFAIRILGTTGRLRLFEFNAASGDWVER